MQKNSYSIEDEKPKINVGGNDIFCMKNKITILVCISQNLEFCFGFVLCEATKFSGSGRGKELPPEADLFIQMRNALRFLEAHIFNLRLL